MRKLTKAEAEQFALMVLSGAPVSHVVNYFWEEEVSDTMLEACAEAWPMQAEVLVAMRVLCGGESWHQMSDPTRLEASLKKHYNELAYFLWTTNYAECDGGEKLKADTCRQAIETKVAGMAGRESPLAQFYQDVLARYEAQGKAN
jgi:hypothetical protein